MFFFYALFPCLVDKLHYDRDEPGLEGCGAGLVCPVLLNWFAYVAAWFFTAQGNLENYILAHVNPANKLPLFVIGCHLGSQALINEGKKTEGADRALREASWSSVATGITIFLAAYTAFQITITDLTNSPPPFYLAGFWTRLFGEMAFPPIYGVWLYALTQAPNGLAARTFSIRPFRVLGELSFCIYCLHYPLLHYYAWLRNSLANPDRGYWKGYGEGVCGIPGLGALCVQGYKNDGLEPWEIVPAFAILFLAAAITNRLVEKPARAWLTRLLAPAGNRRTLPTLGVPAPAQEQHNIEMGHIPLAQAVPVGATVGEPEI